MNSFLTFLSNSYMYFLIAAGVLFFALMGFLVELKKKKDNINPDNNFSEASIPDVSANSEIQTSTAENNIETIGNNLNELDTAFNPAPPIPEEPIETNNDFANESLLSNSNEVLSTEQSVNDDTPVTPETLQSLESTETIQSEQQSSSTQTIEEFK